MAATDSAGGGREGLNKRATGRLLEGEKTPHWKWLVLGTRWLTKTKVVLYPLTSQG